MHIRAIEAQNYLSFRKVRIEDLDPHVNFIVGPNGSGKTTVARLLRTFRETFHDYANGQLPHLDRYLTYDSPVSEIDLSLDVEFTSLEEQLLIRAFLAASLCNPGDVQTMNPATNPQAPIYGTPAGMAAFSGWL